jgi:very-short-patch-repair endonuclease
MTVRLSRHCSDLIADQGGVLARWQADESAHDLCCIDALLRRGRWRALYYGVYAAHNGGMTRPSLLWAAVRRCGPNAVLSHRTAAELDGLVDGAKLLDPVHVTIPGHERVRFSEADLRRDLPRIVVHRSSRLASARHPARTPPRTRLEETLLDMTDQAKTFEAAFGWLSTACTRRLVTADIIRDAVRHRPRLRWRADVLRALEEIAEGVMSNLERQFLRRVERPHRLPKPRRQTRMRRGGKTAYLDILWSEFGVAVELDGLVAHQAETRWQDIHRDNRFAAEGIITLRYSWADVTQRPCQVAAEIAAVLRQRGWTGTLRSCGDSCHAV